MACLLKIVKDARDIRAIYNNNNNNNNVSKAALRHLEMFKGAQ